MNAPLQNNSSTSTPDSPDPDPRVSPIWDRWQNLRTPETVDEALAAIRLATLKIEALERAAEGTPNPDRADALRYSAARWADQRTGLEWALAVLQAGESPLRHQLDALRARYNDLAKLAVLCPDTRALVALLQLRGQSRDAEQEALRMEVMRLEYANDRLCVELEDTRRQLSVKSAEVAALNRKLQEARHV
ncbi:MAG: hypothetical protein EPO40_06075 [Myxococcaceae bacterium]|nr:MAG: hypothetical protein EPO40_06075 [Myxococcaceae bacterium]